MRIKQYESTVVDFVRKESGHFLVATTDNTFMAVLRNTIYKQLAVSEECITPISDENHILRSIKEISARRKKVVLFVERVFNNRETFFLVRQVKNAYSNIKVIILTGEADRQRLVLLHEIGADNFIAKPISINVLIEKIAFTIKPQGKIGKLIDKARQLLAAGNYDDTLKVCQLILEEKPNSAAGLLIMGDAFKGLGYKDKAMECFLEASNAAQLFLEPLKKLAEFFREEGQLEEQLKYLEKLDKLSPLNVDRKVEMGSVHVELGNMEEAEQLFDTALEQAKREALNYLEDITSRVADTYNQKDPARAVKYYRKALELKGDMLDSSDLGTFNSLGIALRRQGRWMEAVDEYKKAQRIAPDDENLHYNIAMAYAEGKDFLRAIKHLEEALALNPKCFRQDPVMSYNFALIHSRGRRNQEAARFARASLELNPNFEKAQKLLASLEGK
ncbi:tetratricopeptide repeat protein [Megalodesulfovibrio gigas]|nr:tetratricopeptide repeat protein [Megalodesulfovibrio gigas]